MTRYVTPSKTTSDMHELKKIVKSLAVSLLALSKNVSYQGNAQKDLIEDLEDIIERIDELL